MSYDFKRKINKIFNQIDKIAKKGKDQVYEYYKLVDEIVDKGEYGYFEQCLYIYYKIDIVNYSGVDEVKKKTWSDILFQTNSSFLSKLKKLYDSRDIYQTGFNVYSSNLSYIGLSLSTSLGPTYSTMSSTQSISLTRSGDLVYFNTTDSDIFKFEIFQSTWTYVDGVEIPSITKSIDQVYRATQSSILTQIPVTYAKDYLVVVYTRPPLVVTNYKFSLSNDNFLGQIKEYDDYNPNVKYLVQNSEFAKIVGQKKTYLEVIKGASTSFIEENDDTISEDQNLLNRYTLAIDILLS